MITHRLLILTVVAACITCVSCGNTQKEIVNIEFDPQTTYTLKETNVETFVSDSGVTRYKIITATWLMFSKAQDPYWYFPDGVYLEKFDTLFNVEASIKADTAYYYERSKLWELDGNVDISNLEGSRFQTSQLFWDQNKQEIYSDSFIRITNGEQIQTGMGFKSNQDMSEYSIYHSGATFIIEEHQAADTAAVELPVDSIIEPI